MLQYGLAGGKIEHTWVTLPISYTNKYSVTLNVSSEIESIQLTKFEIHATNWGSSWNISTYWITIGY